MPSRAKRATPSRTCKSASLRVRSSVRANTHMDARDYRVTKNGAAWNAEVYRADWRQLGVDSLRVLNSIWVHDGKLVDFTSKPLDLHDAEQLGRLWQPGASR